MTTSNPSRRSLLASAAALPALAVPAVAVPLHSLGAAGKSDDAAVLARCEQVIGVLRTGFIRQGWTLDEAAAQRALNYFRHQVSPAQGKMTTMPFWKPLIFSATTASRLIGLSMAIPLS
jgi:hypothetical protein